MTDQNTNRNTCVVKWFNSRQGYGFITNLDDNTKDYFVHQSNLITLENCFKTLYNGEYIECEIKSDDSGKVQAYDVTGIRRGRLMCENRVKNSNYSPSESYSNNYERRYRNE